MNTSPTFGPAGSPSDATLAVGSRAWFPSPALAPLAVAAAATVAGASVLATAYGAVALTALISYAVIAILVARALPGPRFGWANAVTLTRGVGTSLVFGLAAAVTLGATDPSAAAVLVTIGGVCLSLDGVDGKLARRRGEASAFGARFDMETDAALLLGLSVAVAALGVAGWWVLLIGGMRYLYVAASWPVAALRLPVRPRLSGRAIAVVQGVALLGCLLLSALDARPHWLPGVLAGVALSALTYSFGRDVVWQLRMAHADAVSTGRALKTAFHRCDTPGDTCSLDRCQADFSG